MNNNYVPIFDSVLNKEQITHIQFKVLGKDCRQEELPDDYFVVIFLTNCSFYAIHHNNKNLSFVLEDLGVLEYFVNSVNPLPTFN